MYVNHNKLTTWTADSVEFELANSDSFLEKCILLLHDHQNEVEKLARVTINDNDSGLQQADALAFSLYAEKLDRGQHLSSEDLQDCRIPWHRGKRPVQRIAKYRKQLVRIFERQAAKNLLALYEFVNQ